MLQCIEPTIDPQMIMNHLLCLRPNGGSVVVLTKSETGNGYVGQRFGVPDAIEDVVCLADEAAKRLAARGTDEAEKMRQILLAQKKRIAKTADENRQLTLLDYIEGEREQIKADRIHWDRRLHDIDQELASEPDRIRDVYDVKARRVEPIGLAYLWPVTG